MPNSDGSKILHQYIDPHKSHLEQHVKFQLWAYNAVKTKAYGMMSEKSRIVSASLIQKTTKPGVLSNHYHSFCLAIPEWCPCIKIDESRKSLSLKQAHGNTVKENEKKQKENTDRFSFDIDADDLSKYKKVVVRIILRGILNGLLETLKHGKLLETINIPKNSAAHMLLQLITTHMLLLHL